MAGQNRIVNSEIARKAPKGSALKSALNPKTITSKIVEVKGTEKQPKKGK